MTTAPLVLPTAPAPARPRVRRAAAALLAGGLLTTVLGLAPASADVRLVDAYGSRGAYGAATSSRVDSDPATAAESRGVALVDTVVSGGEAAGTGIVLTSDGEVLTNYHVVEGSTSIRVTLPGGGRTYTATVVGADQAADVALLQLTGASGLATARIDDDTLAVGDAVTAVGNAGGTGSLTAADGEVTDLSSSITTQSEGDVAGERLTKLVETSADVVPGDSGGPLLDAQGEVVGVDTAASSGTEIDGYAVPINTALAVVTQIRSGEETAAVRIGPAAFLGVQVATQVQSDSAYGSAYGYGRSRGAVPTTGSSATIAGVVEGDAADEAGLTAGDTITEVGSVAISDALDLTAALATMEPGDRVALTWTTADGTQQSASVALDASPVN